MTHEGSLAIVNMDTPPEVMGLNPFEPGYFDNPYGQYAALRDSMPIHQTTMGSWLLTRWDDVHALLRTPGMSVDERNVANSPTRAERIAEIRAAAGLAEQRRPSRAILNIDPPDHTRIRGLVAKAFTPRAIEQIRGQIQQLTDSLLDELADHGSEPTDLISGLAFPLPFAVINSMLGLPESADTNHLRELSHTITQVLDPLLLIENGPAVLAAAQEMEAILSDAIEWKRARDDDDLLMALIHAEEHGDKLSDAELLE
ncbi:MAG: cytochrome P450, partial [Acidimicrobiales bacterium]|nr:cytochrome P450 [Acidimicrobiales bacterium]